MRHLTVSLLTILMSAASFCPSAFAQNKPWGVSARALEKLDMPGIGFLEPEQIMMCRAIVSPFDGVFAPVVLEQGESLGFVIENNSDVPVSVVVEARDAAGEVQGSLFTQLGVASVRHLGLSVWLDAVGPANLTTYVRVMPLRAGQSIGVVVGQQKVAGARPDLSGQVLDCSAEACSLREVAPEELGSSGSTTGSDGSDNPEGEEPDPPQNSGDETPSDELPDDAAEIGPHGPHNSKEPVVPSGASMSKEIIQG